VTTKSGQLPWWFGIPFLIGGVFVVVLGLVLLRDELRYGSAGASVTGVVTDTIYHPGGGDTGPSYSVRYTYADPATGTGHQGESDVSEETFDTTATGDAIEVTYLPAEPTKSRVGSPEPQLLIPLIVMGGGGIFLVVGVGMLALTRYIRRNGTPSWVHVSSGSSDETPDADMRAILGSFGARFAGADAGADTDPRAAAPPPAAPSRPTTEADLRALDARLTPPPPAPTAPASTTRAADGGEPGGSPPS
jgi:hypothetical protein